MLRLFYVKNTGGFYPPNMNIVSQLSLLCQPLFVHNNCFLCIALNIIVYFVQFYILIIGKICVIL